MKKGEKERREREGICTAVLLAVTELHQQHLQTAPYHFMGVLKYVVLRGAIGHCFPPSLSLFIVLLFGTVCSRLCLGHELPPLCLCVMDILFTEEQVHNLPRTVYVSLLL